MPTSYSLRSVAPANHQVANPEPEPPRVQRSSSAAQGPAWVVHRATSRQREGHPSSGIPRITDSAQDRCRQRERRLSSERASGWPLCRVGGS